MAKFRSWNNKQKRFEYFEDGLYFKGINCRDYYYSNEVNNFNWQNAEMFGQVLPEQNSSGIQNKPFIFAEGDKISFTFQYGGSYKDSFIGVIKFNGYVFYVEDIEDSLTKFDILSVLREDNNAKIIGNIHEGETK